MPSQQLVSVTNIRNGFCDSSDEELPDEEYLLLLRKKECLAYHHICGVFRAQGRLTPEKLKLLKELASVLNIPEVRHKAECCIAVNDSELSRIAECVAGPNTDEEWRTEASHGQKKEREGRVRTAGVPLIDALVRHVERTMDTDKSRTKWNQIVTFRSLLSGKEVNSNNVARKSRHEGKVDVKEETIQLMTEDEIKEEEIDGESSSSVSTTTEPEDLLTPEKDEKVGVREKKGQPDSDLTLMPPPSPIVSLHSSYSSSLTQTSSVINTPHTPSPVPVGSVPLITIPPSSSIMTLPTSPAVITVPPSSSILTLPSAPAVITVPPSSSILTLSSPSPALITVPPPTSLSVASASVTMSTPPPPLLTQAKPCEIDEGTPVLSEDMQFVSLSESMDPCLPPLVVVPPPEPVMAVPHSPTLILPPGMSIQLRDETEESKKRKRPLPQDRALGECSATSPKTMSFSHLSKMTPVMVSVANVSAAGLKVSPTISRAKMAASTASSLTTSTQKVIIVSNASSVCKFAPTIHQPGKLYMRPNLRSNLPRFRPSPVLPAVTSWPQPRVVTVPANCRARSNPLVIPVSGHNLQLKNDFSPKQDNVTVVDTGDKKKVLLGPMAPAKILPKPQSSMFILNTSGSQGTQKAPTPVGLQAGGQTARVLSPRVVEGTGSKQNVVILQKGTGKAQHVTLTNTGKAQHVTLTNTSKDLVQKLMSKKCVVIQSSKALPKTICPKPTAASSPSTSGSNVVVLDLSQEQYRQNLNSKTLAEILQASGVLAPSSATPTISTTLTHTTSVSAPDLSSTWLSLEASKSLALEEVTLPLGQSESVVTLDEAVELLGQTTTAQQVVEVGPQPDSSDQQLYAIASDLDASKMILTERPSTEELSTIVEPLPAEPVEGELISQQFSSHSHKDRAVSIQHSNIDMPANMSLEEYSSQQFENQGLN